MPHDKPSEARIPPPARSKQAVPGLRGTEGEGRDLRSAAGRAQTQSSQSLPGVRRRRSADVRKNAQTPDDDADGLTGQGRRHYLTAAPRAAAPGPRDAGRPLPNITLDGAEAVVEPADVRPDLRNGRPELAPKPADLRVDLDGQPESHGHDDADEPLRVLVRTSPPRLRRRLGIPTGHGRRSAPLSGSATPAPALRSVVRMQIVEVRLHAGEPGQSTTPAGFLHRRDGDGVWPERRGLFPRCASGLHRPVDAAGATSQARDSDCNQTVSRG